MPDQGSPLRGSTAVWLRTRSSTGSMPRVYASSSRADSIAKLPWASAGARMDVGAQMFILACRSWVITLGHR